MIAEASRLAPHGVPILRDVAAGRLALIQCGRGGYVSVSKLKRLVLPALVMLADDDHLNSGPAAWPSAARVMQWARQITVHGAAGHVEEYRAIGLAAQICRRLVLVETGTEHAAACAEAASRWGTGAAVARLLAAPGVLHPAPVKPSDVH